MFFSILVIGWVRRHELVYDSYKAIFICPAAAPPEDFWTRIAAVPLAHWRLDYFRWTLGRSTAISTSENLRQTLGVTTDRATKRYGLGELESVFPRNLRLKL